MRISDWSSDVCSSDLAQLRGSSDAALRRIGEECQGCLPVFDRSQCIHERQCGVGQFARKPQVAAPICRRGRTSHLPRLFRGRSEEHTSELQSLMRSSYAVFCLKKKTKTILLLIHS